MFRCTECGNDDFKRAYTEKHQALWKCTNPRCGMCYDAKYFEQTSSKSKRTEMPSYFKWKSTR